VSAPPAPPDPESEQRLDVGRLALDLRRLADRLRSLAQSRIQVRLDPEPALPRGLEVPAGVPLTRAALGLALAQQLADAALGVQHRADPQPPPRRLVPTLTVFAVGDQVGVTGTDLVAALRGLGPGDAVWTPARLRGTAADVLTQCQDAVAAVTRVV
jgi:hypothetical protein